MFQSFISQFLAKIEEYQRIALFVHINPDFDAYGSAFSLKKWIKDNYPEKQVFLMVPKHEFKEVEKILFNSDKNLPSVVDLNKTLGIILDTANCNRILTQMHIHCKELITIDHHPKIDSFAHLEFVDPTYPANSQILAEIFFFLEKYENKIFNSRLAQYLYAGILTDTDNLMSLSVPSTTYETISKLILKGINRNLVHDSIFVKTIEEKLFNQHVVSQCKMTNHGLIYSIISSHAIKKYKAHNFPNAVNNLKNVLNAEVWVTVLFDCKIKKWKCSIRSKELQINHIAKKFGGGGHKKMAAVILESRCDCYKLLHSLNEYLKLSGLENISRYTKFRIPWLFTMYSFLFKYVLNNKFET